MDIIDFYGSSYKPKILAKSSYKTYFSFSASLLTIILVALSAYLIGRDFFFKLNPKIISSVVRPEASEPVYVTHLNFTVGFRIETPVSAQTDITYAYPRISYFTYNRAAEKENKSPFSKRYYNPVPCGQTEAKNNQMIQNFGLETLLCIDYEKIKKDIGKPNLPLYGDWDEEYYSLFTIEFSNCKLNEETQENYDCISHEEALLRSQYDQYIALYTLQSNLNSQQYDNPLDIRYETTYYALSPFTSFFSTARFSLFKFEDDRGWIFEDINTIVTAKPSSVDKAYRFLGEGAFATGAKMYEIELNFERAQMETKRVYIKIQELAANMGGIIKFVVLVFRFFTGIWHNYKMKSILVRKSMKDPIYPSENNASINNLKKEKTNFDLSLMEYLLISLGFDKKLKQKAIKIAQMEGKLDFEHFLELSSKVEKLEKEAINKRVDIIPLNRNN